MISIPLPVSFLAGIMTILAPCVVTALPVIVGRSADGSRAKAYRVVAGLVGSVFIFSILLKATTVLLGIPTSAWQIVSGLIILFFGVFTLWPNVWVKISQTLKLEQLASKGSQKAFSHEGPLSDVLIGASLGPVFSACSPTYAVIVAVLLPASTIEGLVHLLAFVLGLAVMLLTIAIGGQTLVKKLGWSVDPKGPFKRVLGIIFVILGVMVLFGLDKDLEAWLINRGLYDWQLNFENRLVQ